jgi:hypothetical protein
MHQDDREPSPVAALLVPDPATGNWKHSFAGRSRNGLLRNTRAIAVGGLPLAARYNADQAASGEQDREAHGRHSR